MIHYVKGDATNPIKKPAAILHCCNNIDKWGRGFVLAVSKKWPHAKKVYHDSAKTLGSVSFHWIDPDDILICNIIGQDGIYPRNGIPPIRYEALRKGFETSKKIAESISTDMTFHMPRIGCGLAGGKWHLVSELIDLVFQDCEIYVYDI